MKDLTLRLPQLSDADAIHAIFQSEQAYLTEWLDWPARLKTRQACKQYLNQMVKKISADEAFAQCLVRSEAVKQLVNMTRKVSS